MPISNLGKRIVSLVVHLQFSYSKSEIWKAYDFWFRHHLVNGYMHQVVHYHILDFLSEFGKSLRTAILRIFWQVYLPPRSTKILVNLQPHRDDLGVLWTQNHPYHYQLSYHLSEMPLHTNILDKTWRNYETRNNMLVAEKDCWGKMRALEM